MKNPELTKYIEGELAKGASRETVIATLKKVGWSDADISEAVGADGAMSVGGSPEIRTELSALRQDFDGLRGRFANLETKVLGTSAPVSASPTMTPAMSAFPHGEKFAPVAISQTGSIQIPSTSSGDIRQAVPEESIESRVTGKWFATLGILAILFGVGFFLKYAFDNNLIGETGRVIMGIFGGLALLVIGDIFSRRDRYREYSFYLSGGGLALLYLSIYAAYNYYHLIGQGMAFGVMAVITIIGAVLSIFSNSERFAGISLIGGFLTPFMASSGEDNQIALLGYILILNLGFLLMSYAKRWRNVYLIAFVGTYAVFFGWFSGYYAEEKLWTTMTFLSAYFIVFLIAPFLVSVTKGQSSEASDLVVAQINAGVYFATSYLLLKPDYEPFLGFFFVVWAAIYLLGSYILTMGNKDDTNGILGLAGIGLVLVTVAIPIQLSGKWITLAWAMEGFVLTWIGIALDAKKIRTFAHVVYIVAVIHLLAIDSNYSAWQDGYVAFMNSRFITFVLTSLSLFAGAYLSRDAGDKLTAEEKSIPDILAVAGHLIAVAGLTIETVGYFDHQVYLASNQASTVFDNDPYGRGYVDSSPMQNQKNLALSLLWGAYSGFLMIVGIARRSRGTRLLAITGFSIVILKVFLYDSSALSQLYRIISFIVLGVILLVISFLFYRYKERFKEFVME